MNDLDQLLNNLRQASDDGVRADAAKILARKLKDGLNVTPSILESLMQAMLDACGDVRYQILWGIKNRDDLILRDDVERQVKKVLAREREYEPPNKAVLNTIDRIQMQRQALTTQERRRPRLTPEGAMRDKIFISYSRKDAAWMERLKTHLAPIERSQLINKPWSDKNIQAGQDWLKEIKSALETAKVAVLLVTADFLASPFINDEELTAIFEARDRGEVTVIWIAVSASNYKYTQLKAIQAVNNPGKPLDSLSHAEQEQELARIAEIIERTYNS